MSRDRSAETRLDEIANEQMKIALELEAIGGSDAASVEARSKLRSRARDLERQRKDAEADCLRGMGLAR